MLSRRDFLVAGAALVSAGLFYLGTVMPNESCWRVRPGALEEGADGCLRLHHQGAVYDANDTAAALLRLCDGRNTLADMTATLVHAGASRACAKRDAQAFLDRMIREGVVIPA